ncbi:nuclear pore complex protein Nup107-like [Symsagittifera roscoffensis]|uniref:nuclear pore complex protein Nup107-like n=1 Tax=Symsagittifera roscoffensis TaxID=84072 RepID=UPI00307B8B2F
MDFTKLLDDTRVLLNDCVADERENITFAGRRSLLSNTTVGFDHTFLSAKRQTMNETTFVANEHSGNTMALRSCQNFAEIMKDNEMLSTMDKIEKFIDFLTFELSIVKESDRSLPSNLFLQLELNTWKLLLFLSQTRLMDENENIDVQKILESNYSHKVISNALNSSKQELKEVGTLIHWLESIYAKPSIAPPVGFTYLEDTIHELAAKSKKGESQYHVDIEFDPNLKVGAGDRSNVDAFMRFAFSLIRSGKFSDMEQFAIKMGFTWLLPVLEGSKLFDDPNYKRFATSNEEKSPSGNKNRHLWRQVVTEIVKNPSINSFEKAIYAYCSGNIDALLVVAKTWEDKLWSYLVCLKSAVENYNISLYAAENQDTMLEEPEIDFRDIFMKVDAVEETREKHELRSFFRGLQACVILNSLDTSLVAKLENLECSEESMSLLWNRFSATFCIVVSQLFSTSLEDTIDRFVTNLGAFLVTSSQFMTIMPFLKYTADPESVCLKLLVNSKLATHNSFLNELEKDGFDTCAIRKQLIEHYQGNYHPQENEVEEINNEEVLLIDSTLKLRKGSENPIEFLCAVNSLGRKFLGMKRYQAAHKLLSEVPRSIIEETLAFYKNVSMSVQSVVELPNRESNILHEFLDLRNVALMILDLDQIRNAFNRSTLENGEISLNIDHETTRDLIAVIEKVYQTLSLEKGWLLDEFDLERTNDSYFTDMRTRQIQLVRSIAIPDIVIKSLKLLKDHNLFSIVQSLMVCLMSEENKLIELFSPETLEIVNEVVLDVDIIEDVLISH